MPEVAVIGAGIAGLTAGFRLLAENVDVTVFEAAAKVGGVIQTDRANGFLVEHGPNSIQRQSGTIDEIVLQLGLEERKVSASPAARQRFIVRAGRPQPAPSSPLKLATSDLFGRSAKFRILREPFVPPGPRDVEESVAEFIERRLGSEILDYGINPFVGGVYAGDPEQLSMRHAFPGIYEMEQKSGSIIKGQIDKARGAATAVQTHSMYSFKEGLHELPSALHRALGNVVRTNSPVRTIRRNGSSWSIDGQSFHSIIYAAPLHQLSGIEIKPSTENESTAEEMSVLSNVKYPPLSIVATGYRREHIKHPLDGFGMLVPEAEKSFRLLGSLFTSSVFPGRAPEGHVLLTSFVGGVRNAELAGRPSDALFDIVDTDLDRLLGVRGTPVHRRHVFWAKSIPQYNVGYGDVLAAMGRLEDKFLGLFLAGNFRDGVSVGDAALSGSNAATKCLEYLASR